MSATMAPQIACTRCRRRKKKCDHALPACGECVRSGVECVRFLERKPRDSAAVPWNFVKDLEARVARLEKRLMNCTCHPPAHPARPDTALSDKPSPSQPRVRLSKFPPDAQYADADLGVGSRDGQSCSTLSPPNVHTAILSSNEDGEEHDISQRLLVREADLYNYLQYVQPNWPFLAADVLAEWYNIVVEQHTSEDDHRPFFVLLVCAIGALYSIPSEQVPSPVERSRMLQSEAASKYLQHAARESPTVRAQAYLLIIVHALHAPTPFELHDVTNEAILEVTAALSSHSSTDPLSSGIGGPIGVDRCVLLSCFSAYQIIASLWSRPLPSLLAAMDEKVLWDLHLKLYTELTNDQIGEQGFWLTFDAEPLDAAVEHVFALRLIQSRIRGLWNGLQELDNHEWYRNLWSKAIVTELSHWRAMIPLVSSHNDKSTNSHPLAMLKLYDVCIFSLYQNENYVPSPEEMLVLLAAASESIRCFRRIQSHRPMVYCTWSGLFEQFRAGITLLSCFWETDPNQRTVAFAAPETQQAFEDCEFTLTSFTHRWKSARMFLDVYKTILSETPFSPSLSSDFIVSESAAHQLSTSITQLQQARVPEAVISMITRILARAQSQENLSMTM